MANEPGHIRWTPSEWQQVAAHAVPHLNKGVPTSKALMRAQRTALPKARQRDEETMRRLVWQTSTKRFLDEARATSPEKLAEIAPPPPPRKSPAPRKKLDEGRDYGRPAGHMVRWTTLEKARVARQVNQWKAAGDARTLSRLIIEAQELVIERDRRRPVLSIQAGVGRLNDQMLADGTANEWLLTAEMESEAKEAAAPAASQAPSEMPPQSPVSAPQGAEAAQASQPPAQAPRELSEAARAFGETVMGALDKLLAAHAETMLTAVYAKLSAAAATTTAQIAAQIEHGMRETVHKIVEAELGGPVASPSSAAAAPEPEPPAPPAAPEQPPPRQIKVDVVGLNNGSMEQEVRKAINGHADLRFVNPDAGNGYAPHRGRHCIMVTQRVPHALKHKIKAAGIEPIYVKSTAGHVVHAIEELNRALGMYDGVHG